MPDNRYAVRELCEADIAPIIAYHEAMGARYSKLLGRGADAAPVDAEAMKASFHKRLADTKPFDARSSTTDILLIDGQPVGHTVLQNIAFGDTGKMHFHIWLGNMQGKNFGGMLALGRELAEVAMRHFFINYQLRMIIGEPSHVNPMPNRVLRSMGFTPVDTYLTKPGPIAGTTMVNRYEILRGYFPDLA